MTAHISQFSIGCQLPPIGYFKSRRLRSRANSSYELADHTVNPAFTLRARLEAAQMLFEAPETLGFYVPSEPKNEKPAEIIKDMHVYQEPFARNQLYGMLNAISLQINGRTPEDPLLEEQCVFNRVGALIQSELSDGTLEQYQSTAKALLAFDFRAFLLDSAKREGEYAEGLEYSQHPQAEVSHSYDNRFPLEQLRLQRFMKRYGLQMRDVVGADTWSDTFRLGTRYSHRYGLTESEFQEMARRYIGLVDQAGREKCDRATAIGRLSRLMVNDYMLGRGISPEVAVGLQAIPKIPVNWQEILSVL